ncbi:MAG: DNA adenine methylase [Bacillota bacterium]
MEKRRAVGERRQAARPFIKWAGGKKQILRELLARAPQTFGTYFEPFLGGGAVFFSLSPSKAVLSDLNPHLMNAYLVVRDRVDELAESLEVHRADRDYYYMMRDLSPETMSDVERASWFIYLNKTCYNGLWRVNKSGRFNVPFGRYKNPRILDRSNLHAASRALRAADLRCSDFEDAVQDALPGDFVYFDPPYLPLGGTAVFTSYTGEGFDVSEQERLAEVFRRLSRKGVFVMLSNSDVPLVRRLYRGFRIDTIQAARAISCRGDRRGLVGEVIITGY